MDTSCYRLNSTRLTKTSTWRASPCWQCGTGFVLNALKATLPSARIAGSKLHSRGLPFAIKRHAPEIEFIQMDACRSGLLDVFDLAGAFDVLEHIPEDEAVLAGIAGLLGPAGRFIATVPQHPWLWSAAGTIAHHQRRYKFGELAAKVERNGMRVIYRISFVTLAFPLMIAVRLAE
jgi:SAM-dependent methyltransferase